jgi:hypothetical protein
MKNSNGTLGGGDFYLGRAEVVKVSGFVNSKSSRNQSEISERFFTWHSSDRRHSEGVQCVSCCN